MCHEFQVPSIVASLQHPPPPFNTLLSDKDISGNVNLHIVVSGTMNSLFTAFVDIYYSVER